MSEKIYEIKPITGNFLHGVTEVTKGKRYTVAIWYTQDYAHIEV